MFSLPIHQGKKSCLAKLAPAFSPVMSSFIALNKDIWSCGGWIDGYDVHGFFFNWSFCNVMPKWWIFISCEEFDNFAENQLISFDQWAIYTWYLCRFVVNCTYSFTHMYQNKAIAWMNEKFYSVVNNRLIVQRFQLDVLKNAFVISELSQCEWEKL